MREGNEPVERKDPSRPDVDSPLHRLQHSVEQGNDIVADLDDVPPLGPIARLSRQVILMGILPVFSIVYLWQAMTIPLPTRDLVVSPREFPTLVAALMVLVSLSLAVIELRKILAARTAAARGTELAVEEDDDKERITSWRDAWVTLGALVAYIGVFSALGFFLSTALFLIGLSTYLTPRHWLRNVIVSVLFTLGVYLLFTNLLGVQLPAGLLSGIL